MFFFLLITCLEEGEAETTLSFQDVATQTACAFLPLQLPCTGPSY